MMTGDKLKLFKISILLYSITLFSGTLFSMPDFNEIDKPGAVAKKNATDEANKFVRERYGKQGLQSNGDYIAVGESVIPGKSGNLKWELSRAASYDKAILNAKSELVKFIAREVGQKALSEIEVGDPNSQSSSRP